MEVAAMNMNMNNNNNNNYNSNNIKYQQRHWANEKENKEGSKRETKRKKQTIAMKFAEPQY